MASYSFIGSTRSGKTMAVIWFVLQLIAEGIVVIFVDKQPDSGAVLFKSACDRLNYPCVHEDCDSELWLPCDYASATGNPIDDQLVIEDLCEALAAARGMVTSYGHVQIMQSAMPFIRCKMMSGLPFHKMRYAWFSNCNGGLIKRCDDQECTEWLESRPTEKSPRVRDMEPAMRFIAPLTHGPSLMRRDVGESDTVEILNSGSSIAISGGNRITEQELKLLGTYRINEVINAAQQGKLSRKVVIVIEEAEI